MAAKPRDYERITVDQFNALLECEKLTRHIETWHYGDPAPTKILKITPYIESEFAHAAVSDIECGFTDSTKRPVRISFLRSMIEGLHFDLSLAEHFIAWDEAPSEVSGNWVAPPVIEKTPRKPRQKKIGSSVYFVQAEIGGPIKIGFSTNPRARIKALQSASPFPLIFLGVIPAESEDDEMRLHQQFSGLRIHGEWFRCDESLVLFIRQNSAKVKD